MSKPLVEIVWEHFVMDLTGDKEADQMLLDSCGKYGWELISVVSKRMAQYGHFPVAYFKRLKA